MVYTMRFHSLLALFSVGSLLLATSCKESTSSSQSSNPTDSKTAVDLASQAHVLYLEGETLPSGTELTQTENGSMDKIKMAFEVQGNAMRGVMSRNNVEQKITAIDSETQLTVFYKRDDETEEGTMNGQASPKKRTEKPLHGKTVIMTKASDGIWTAKLKSGEVNDDIQKAMDKMAKSKNNDDDKDVYGTEPRKVGDTWKVDPSSMSSFSGGDMSNVTGSLKVTFDSIRKHAGLDCAVLLFNLNLQGNTKEGMQMKMTAKVEALRSLKYHVDVDLSLDGVISAKGDLEGGVGKMQMSGPIKMHQSVDVKLP